MPEGRLVRVEGRGELFARLHRHPDPDAPVVLLLHGWTASIDLQFVTAYEALAARCTFVGIDHRGHGRGLRTPDAFTLEDAADDAAALVRQLGLGPVIAVGYSMGGPISMLLARRHPDLVRGLVVQATALAWNAHAARPVPVAGAADRRLVAAHEGLPPLPEPRRPEGDRCPWSRRRRAPGAAVHPVARQRDVAQRPVRDGRRRPGPRRLRRPPVGVDARRAGRRAS